MGNRSINSQVYRALLARSGNKCAFPGCSNPLFNHGHKFIAQLCHIEGVKGERHNPLLTDEEINSYSNILFLCYEHHQETNDVDKFPVEALRKMKLDHEQKYILSPMVVNMSHVYSLRKENEEYWEKVGVVNKSEHVVPDLRIEIRTKATYEELYSDLSSILESLENLHSSFVEYDMTMHWEVFNLGFPNHLTKIKVIVEQMRIIYFESHLANNPHDYDIREKLQKLRKNFIEVTAKFAGHVD